MELGSHRILALLCTVCDLVSNMYQRGFQVGVVCTGGIMVVEE